MLNLDNNAEVAYSNNTNRGSTERMQTTARIQMALARAVLTPDINLEQVVEYLADKYPEHAKHVLKSYGLILRKKGLLSISSGNVKTGSVPAVSMLPVVTCASYDSCARDCYAVGMVINPMTGWAVFTSWLLNTLLWQEDAASFEGQLDHYLKYMRPPAFRFFVGGDFPDQSFVDMACRLAKKHPRIKFWSYTKTDLTFDTPANLNVLRSYFEESPQEVVAMAAKRKGLAITSDFEALNPARDAGALVICPEQMVKHKLGIKKVAQADRKVSCISCQLCADKRFNIGFILH